VITGLVFISFDFFDWQCWGWWYPTRCICRDMPKMQILQLQHPIISVNWIHI